jgi:type IV pilus assembly protein PilM
MDPVVALADAVREALRTMQPQQAHVVGALPGQTVVIRYPRLPDQPETQLEQAIQTEAGQSIPYDLSEVFLDWTLLETIDDGEGKQLKVLLVAARHEVIDARVQIANSAEIQYAVLGVDSLALADAAESCGLLHDEETVALINIGLTSASIHFVKDGISNFIRDVSWGSRELIQALAKAKHLDYDAAEKALYACGAESEKTESAPPPMPEPVAPPPVSMGSPLDDPFDDLDGPVVPPPPPPPKTVPSSASLLDPFDDELSESLTPAPTQVKAGSSDGKSMDEVLTPPLARLVSEVRRSFDFYEHQLYENPVDRIILSGGIAHLPLLGSTLAEELGLEAVEVADPSEGAIIFGDNFSVDSVREHPAQFMVAVGLAARGMADL